MNVGAIDPRKIEIETFLSSWYGPPNLDSGEIDPAFDWIPEGLKRVHELSARWDLPLEGVKRLLPLAELSEEEGKFIFMADQGGWAWAFDQDAPLAVFEAKDDEPWRQLAGGWEDFFLYHIFTETVESAPFVQWSPDVSMGDIERALDPFRMISFFQSSWPAEGWCSYMADGMVADVGPKRGEPGRYVITVGAKSTELLEYLHSIIGVDWRVRRN
ncbi:hypothetical protein ACFW2D_17090 [Streptomyces sp. NPDC058914]|uniref:hypothetical protein n=1 Tax=Streptomyces sp. NPDC058914 TaxID=3346671 RepID=UPI0036BC17E5